jgi:acetyl esterase/lipase
MPLDAQAKALLDQVVAIGGPPLHTLGVKEARQALEAMATLQGEPPAVASVANRSVPGTAGDIPVRVYTPDGSPPFPIVVFYHGGGWVLGSLDTHDGPARDVARAAGCIVVSVDYRLAPEHKFPAAAEDCYAALKWVAEHGAVLGGDPARIAVAGDSAGGNLSAVVALMARDRGGPRIAHQVLIYPVTDAPSDNASYRDNADGYLLTAEDMRWFWNHYTRTPADRRNPYAAPLQATSVQGLPPALVLTAEFDPLRDEAEAYAARLKEAGVPVQLIRYDGMIHGFFGMGGVLAQARAAVRAVGDTLKRSFSGRA